MAYTLIDTEELLHVTLSKILSCLSSETVLYLDSEGHKLGRFGTLDLLQLHISSLQVIVVIDVFTLRKKAFITDVNGFSMKFTLEFETIVKVFFDIHNDSDALFNYLMSAFVVSSIYSLRNISTWPGWEDTFFVFKLVSSGIVL